LVCRCHHPLAGGGIWLWLRRESLRHIFASPGYDPGTISVNVTWMEREFNAYQTHRNMYPSIFNPFSVILSVSLTVRYFNTFCTFWPPLGTPLGQSRRCYMDGKRIKCSSNALRHVPIYLQPIPRYSEILVENCNFLIPALHGVAPWTIAVDVTWMER